VPHFMEFDVINALASKDDDVLSTTDQGEGTEGYETSDSASHAVHHGKGKSLDIFQSQCFSYGDEIYFIFLVLDQGCMPDFLAIV